MTFDLDLIVKNGIVATAGDEFASDIGIKDGKIVLLARDIQGPPGCEVIDARGGYVTVRKDRDMSKEGQGTDNLALNLCFQPGGIDSHVHIAQSAAKSLGAKSADDWTSATMSALGGGTTSVIAFAVQPKGGSMKAAVDDYHKLATNNALCDYSFHVIVTDPTYQQMHEEMLGLMESGITSVKIYSTYPALQLNDTQILDTFYAARQHGFTVSKSLSSHMHTINE
jgi:dihydropyrimidinase